MQYHLCMSVKGALRQSKEQLEGILTNSDGRSMTANEVIDALRDELAKGHEVLPIGVCDNFDWKKGCMGHDENKFNIPTK